MTSNDRGIGRREFCGLAAALALGAPGAPAAGGKVKIGLVKSLFREVPEAFVLFAMQPFKAFLESKMSVSSALVNGGTPVEMGKKLMAGSLDLGVFHGVEFAWARQRYKKLQPLFIAVNQEPVLHAHLIVNRSAPIKGVDALARKRVGVPNRSREHCWLFLERHCTRPGVPVNRYLNIAKAFSCTQALAALAANEGYSAVLVDGIEWEEFKKKRPGQAARLRPLVSSAPFPCALVAYAPGHLALATLGKFKAGMLNAQKSPQGREMLAVMRITGFEEVPRDFDRQLDLAARAYPPS